MSDFNALLLRLFAALTMGLVETPHAPGLGLVTSLMLVAGFKTRYVAVAMATVGLGTLALLPWDFLTPAAGLRVTGPAILVMALLAIALLGAGGFSVDEWRMARRAAMARRACGDGPVATRRRATSEATDASCLERHMYPGSRLRAWLESPTNPNAR